MKLFLQMKVSLLQALNLLRENCLQTWFSACSRGSLFGLEQSLASRLKLFMVGTLVVRCG